MSKDKLSKKGFEELCVTENIILKRFDPVNKQSFYLPNLVKIGIMIREFDFLVEGAARGKAINEISNTELEIFKRESDASYQTNLIASKYSKASIFLEEKRAMIEDKNSENWGYLFVKYFSLEDIYEYFHKTESASSFFRKYEIYDEMVEIYYNVKLMEYLKSQVELLIPIDEDKKSIMRFDSIELRILVLYQYGFLDEIKGKLGNNYYENGAMFIANLLELDSQHWKSIQKMLIDLDSNPEESIKNDHGLKIKLKDLLYHYKIDLR